MRFTALAAAINNAAHINVGSEGMRKLMIAAAAIGTLVVLGTPSLAQGIRIGPGGVQIDDGRGYGEDRDERRFRRMCRELRDRCENRDIYGEEGQGNCRRYRRTCG